MPHDIEGGRPLEEAATAKVSARTGLSLQQVAGAPLDQYEVDAVPPEMLRDLYRTAVERRRLRIADLTADGSGGDDGA